MNWAIKIISKILITEFFPISWGGYDKGFYGNQNAIQFLYMLILEDQSSH